MNVNTILTASLRLVSFLSFLFVFLLLVFKFVPQIFGDFKNQSGAFRTRLAVYVAIFSVYDLIIGGLAFFSLISPFTVGPLLAAYPIFLKVRLNSSV